MEDFKRTPAKKKAEQIAKILKPERPDYNYLREIFRSLRKELNVKVVVAPKRLPYVLSEEEIKRYYEAAWQSKNIKHILIIKTLLYTGIRVSELVNVKISDINFNQCQIRINKGKRNKDRIVPFPETFREALAVHAETMREKGAAYLFESSWKRPYSDRGVRKVLEAYTEKAGIKRSISPHRLRHFLLTWLKKQGIDDSQKEYNEVIKNFPV